MGEHRLLALLVEYGRVEDRCIDTRTEVSCLRGQRPLRAELDACELAAVLGYYVQLRRRSTVRAMEQMKDKWKPVLASSYDSWLGVMPDGRLGVGKFDEGRVAVRES